MYLLYLDESGHQADPTTEFFVLAGFSIFERQTHWLEAAIDPIAARFNRSNPRSVELHGAPMRGGRDGWSGIAPADRVQAVVDVLSLLSNAQLKLRVFASVIEKSLLAKEHILARSFEHVACQFDAFLASLFRRRNDPQRGLVILDKTSYEEKLQSLSHVFKHEGHTSGRRRNFAEVPLCLDSKASRLMQMADLIAYWIFRYFQSGDDRGFKLIQPCFHGYGGLQQGLTQLVSDATRSRLTAISPSQFPFPKPSVSSEDTARAISGSLGACIESDFDPLLGPLQPLSSAWSERGKAPMQEVEAQHDRLLSPTDE